jgi:hypothetical protein
MKFTPNSTEGVGWTTGWLLITIAAAKIGFPLAVQGRGNMLD